MTNYWNRMRRRQLSRRALLRASARAGVGAAGLALVGCGDDDDDGAQPAAAQRQEQEQQQQQQAMQQQQVEQQEQPAEQQAAQAEQQEQQVQQQQQAMEQEEQTVADDNIDYDATVIGAYGAFPQSLDWGSALARGGQAASKPFHFGAVFPVDSRGSAISGGLAEWEFVSDEALIVTVSDGRYFHNGEPVTAEDVKFTIDRLTGRSEHSPDYTSAWTGELTWSGDTDLIDEQTLRIEQAVPSVDAANSMSGSSRSSRCGTDRGRR